jgi:TolB-like protein
MTRRRAARHQMTLSSGTKLGRYEIRSQIGEGGMGEVYLAEDMQLGRQVAVKFLPGGLVADEQANKRLMQEARAAATLDHPNICAVYEVSEAAGRSFIVMQYLEGQTLQARIQSKRLALNESLAIATEIADGLAEAHARGIIHRDIKPANIMVTSRGAKVMDFGLARLVSGAAESEAKTQSLLTTPGTILGTVPYMSPEQVKGEKVDVRTDIFSFGVMLYEMLSGHQPFTNRSAAETISAILNEEPPMLSRYAPDLPEELQRIARKCLEKDRNLRYQGAAEVRVDLQRLQRDTGSAAVTIARGGTEAEAPPPAQVATVRIANLHDHAGAGFPARRLIVPAAVVVLAFLAAAYFYYPRGSAVRPREIKSLAVLPLKSLDAGENYLGLGIADAVIGRINQTEQLVVRPTSAVRRYLNEDTDALTAARQLHADAVLEGSVQHAGDVLRVSVNLLRTSDGVSLWSDHFDMRSTNDVFTIQDKVAQQVASHLRLQLDPAQQARLTKRSTSNPVAYEFYMKGFYSFDQRVAAPKAQVETSIGFFKQATEADPNFALAHARLAGAYATKGVFVDTTEPVWAERAREEINRAQALDPQLAETHIARNVLLFSVYEGYQGAAAIREVLLAQQLNPNVGHGELAFLYIHLGLEDPTVRELQRASEIDPTSEFVKEMTRAMYFMGGKYDEYEAHRELYRDYSMEAWYLMGKGRLDEAEKQIEEWTSKKPDSFDLQPKTALLLALKGDYRGAEAAIPAILSSHPVKDPFYHHAAYDIACIYALESKSVEAVKWLREANATGFQCYPLFERDAYLNRIRQAPEFIQFMTEMKAQNERYRREFG